MRCRDPAAGVAKLSAVLRGRLMARRQPLELVIGVRVPAPQLVERVGRGARPRAQLHLRPARSGERWVGREYHGLALATQRDATVELLELAREPLDDRIDALGELRIAVSR